MKLIANLSRDSHYVLTDDDDKVIAIIHVPQGEQDITQKVIQAIKDDCQPEYAVLISDLILDPTKTNSFEVEVQEERGDETHSTTFYLDQTEVY